MKYGIRKLNARDCAENEKVKVESRRKDLHSIDWEMATSAASDDSIRMASSLYDLFLAVLDVHAPLKIRNIKTGHAYTPWISQCIKNLIPDRDRVERRAERDPALWPDYRQLRNTVTTQLKTAVKSYFSNLIDEKSNNPDEI